MVLFIPVRDKKSRESANRSRRHVSYIPLYEDHAVVHSKRSASSSMHSTQYHVDVD